ncbi:hypothetical protein LJPFL01_2358 [Lelliottia jeotgali]|nr:hypothetical protein LJPFL01_2358 [Lelliottia jeotgali]
MAGIDNDQGERALLREVLEQIPPKRYKNLFFNYMFFICIFYLSYKEHGFI